MALGRQGLGATAWDEWTKNSLERHATVYPDVITGTWSASDTYQSVYGPQPGDAGNPYALHNAWAHTATMITLPDLIGRCSSCSKGCASQVVQVYFACLLLFGSTFACRSCRLTIAWSFFLLSGLRILSDSITMLSQLPLAAYTLDTPLFGLARPNNGNGNQWAARKRVEKSSCGVAS